MKKLAVGHTIKHTPELDKEAERFYGLLNTGEENAREASDLLGDLSYPNDSDHRRRLRLLTNAAIELGLAVCSSAQGYFRPATLEEGKGNLARIDSYIVSLARRRQHLAKLLERQFTAQLPLPNLAHEVEKAELGQSEQLPLL